MLIHRIVAAALLLSISTAQADGLKPAQALRIDLGQVSGIAYYTVEADGFHVIATFARSETDGNPFRIQAVLAAGQSVILSSAGKLGTEPVSIRVARHGERLVVEGAKATD